MRWNGVLFSPGGFPRRGRAGPSPPGAFDRRDIRRFAECYRTAGTTFARGKMRTPPCQALRRPLSMPSEWLPPGGDEAPAITMPGNEATFSAARRNRQRRSDRRDDGAVLPPGVPMPHPRGGGACDDHPDACCRRRRQERGRPPPSASPAGPLPPETEEIVEDVNRPGVADGKETSVAVNYYPGPETASEKIPLDFLIRKALKKMPSIIRSFV